MLTNNALFLSDSLRPLLWGYNGLDRGSVLTNVALFLDESNPSPPVDVEWSASWLLAN